MATREEQGRATVVLDTGFPRRPSGTELAELKTFFPELQADTVWLTGPPTDRYNCIAWTLGFTDRWINPPNPMSNFNALYRRYGWTPITKLSPRASIDGWGRTVADMTHGSRVYLGPLLPAGMWESKLGQSWRITHGRQDLTGRAYGAVLVSFDKTTAAAGERMSEELPVDADENDAGPAGAPADLSRLAAELEAVPAAVREAFDQAYAAWEGAWFRGDLLVSSDTRDRRAMPEFAHLLAMGPGILPLVVRKLLGPGGYMALQLYEALRGSPDPNVRHTGDEPDPVEGEQARAERAARLWLAGA